MLLFCLVQSHELIFGVINTVLRRRYRMTRLRHHLALVMIVTTGFSEGFLSLFAKRSQTKSDRRNHNFKRSQEQCRQHPDIAFPCSVWPRRSPTVPPASVHHLRPGDIDVVAALGDSITAGAGAMADNILQVGLEYPGVAFSMGGDATWRQFMTLPNILKEFNPHVYGYSLGHKPISANDEKVTGMNFATSGSESDQIIDQAHRLVHKMKHDPHVDFRNDWKLVTILVGHNDLCSHTCKRHELLEPLKDGSPRAYQRNVAKALDILHQQLPRAFVNLLPIIDVSRLFDVVEKPPLCEIVHTFACPCFFATPDEDLAKHKAVQLIKAYYDKLYELVNSGRYDTREDFTVVVQPFFTALSLPMERTRKGYGTLQPDLAFLAPDCFHFAQALHAFAARALWNNLLEPVGHKSASFMKDTNIPFLCPTEHHPFLATKKNSNMSMHEWHSIRSDKAQDFLKYMNTAHDAHICHV